jgi:holo-[acyl-carrier protein] synthase
MEIPACAGMTVKMILGIGTDIIDIRRIERVLKKHGTRFLERVFTEEERNYADSRPANYAATLAKRFAAKEACAKALGTGLGQGVGWKDIGVIRKKFGPPSLVLKGKAMVHLQRLTPEGLSPKIYVSLTDDHPQALAFVVISAASS